jgi:hypothetical protein
LAQTFISRIIGGNVGDDDETIVLSFAKGDTKLYSSVAYLDGPHFFINYPAKTGQIIPQEATLTVEIQNPNAQQAISTIKV